MLLPITSKEKPYIEFRINKEGEISLSVTASWWGGKKGGFLCNDRTEGNTCEPKHLKSYIKAFKIKKIKDVKKQISELQKQLKTFKSQSEHWDSLLNSL
jgi:hypothetical protein